MFWLIDLEGLAETKTRRNSVRWILMALILPARYKTKKTIQTKSIIASSMAGLTWNQQETYL